MALALKQKYPGSKITWLTDADAAPLLYNNPSVDELLGYDFYFLTQLSVERFDRIICLDKEPRAAGLASILAGRRKYGFGWDPKGALVPLNKESRYLYDLGLSDRLKFQINQKSYQQLIIEAAGLEYTGQKYQYRETPEESQWAGAYLSNLFRRGTGLPLIGLNTGVGRAFPTKAWPVENYARLARSINQEKIGRAIILGGPGEKVLVKKISHLVPGIFASPCDLSLRRFAALISRLDIIVSADSLAMHLGIALERKVIALFGPTCSQEIDLYGRGEKLDLRLDCSPCYKTSCAGAKCLAGISQEDVLAAVKRNL